jgi:hypothetical protein
MAQGVRFSRVLLSDGSEVRRYINPNTKQTWFRFAPPGGARSVKELAAPEILNHLFEIMAQEQKRGNISAAAHFQDSKFATP